MHLTQWHHHHRVRAHDYVSLNKSTDGRFSSSSVNWIMGQTCFKILSLNNFIRNGVGHICFKLVCTKAKLTKCPRLIHIWKYSRYFELIIFLKKTEPPSSSDARVFDSAHRFHYSPTVVCWICKSNRNWIELWCLCTWLCVRAFCLHESHVMCCYVVYTL